MKVIDLRPLLVRSFTRSARAPATVAGVPAWAGSLVQKVMARRVAGRPAATGSSFLVSVGNLALGGTGKTPVVMDLAAGIHEMGLTGAVLTRGYGSRLPGPLLVLPQNDLAGDEARLMASRLGSFSWPVVQSRQRSRGLDFLQTEGPPAPQIILLEDAHQTAGLARHLDLVILDSWSIHEDSAGTVLLPRTGAVFPFGPWRENADGARRADALLVETTGEAPSRTSWGQPVFAFHRTLELLPADPANEAEPVEQWALVSGIARPHRFEQEAGRRLNGKVVLSVRCRDHARYGTHLLKKIVAEMDRTGAQGLVTTAKDWVKLSGVWEDPRPVRILAMDVHWNRKGALVQWLVERALRFSTNSI